MKPTKKQDALLPDVIPTQPVENPILCSPFREPTEHWQYQDDGSVLKLPARRKAGYYFKSDRVGHQQGQMFINEQFDDLPLANDIRADVKIWRENGYPGVTDVTRRLLQYWSYDDRKAGGRRQLFFCQREAVETIIYLSEIMRDTKFAYNDKKITTANFQKLLAGERIYKEHQSVVVQTLGDKPNDDTLAPLIRHCCKMATGSGKTVVMAMLLAWSFCNRGRKQSDKRFPSTALIVCPNLTIKKRLSVLNPADKGNYYDKFDLVPSNLKQELAKGKIISVNWHKLGKESPNAEGGKTYRVVQKGEESPEAFARRILKTGYNDDEILVINDEAHHAYRPNVSSGKNLTPQQLEATVWVEGLDMINAACGIRLCVDLSATPFFLQGSGYKEGTPHPWIVSDFGLVDAIESGIVKIPRIPVSDTTGRPEPEYFNLYKNIAKKLVAGEKLSGGNPKPEVVWRGAEPALKQLAGQYKQKFDSYAERNQDETFIPPVMIVVCDNTDIAQIFYEKISGQTTADETRIINGKPKVVKVPQYGGNTDIFPDIFANTSTTLRTVRIDTKALEDTDDEGLTKDEAMKNLRNIIDTVGKKGEDGEQIRCVVSVQMLSEGWDANNVTHILGLRAFGSQLLCEQVAGRALRRISYEIDPETERFAEEYADLYGVPFSLIPFKGRGSSVPPEPNPSIKVAALQERKHLEIRFPNVEGYISKFDKYRIQVDVSSMEKLAVNPQLEPTVTTIKAQAGSGIGLSISNDFSTEVQSRATYYDSTLLQTIEFEIARRITNDLVGVIKNQAKIVAAARHLLFPQVLKAVKEYVATKIDFNKVDKREIGLEKYARVIAERLHAAIEPASSAGNAVIIPLLNRTQPIGTTANVSFLTTKNWEATQKSHVDKVVFDTGQWEQVAKFYLESSTDVVSYVKNDHLECAIPYSIFGVQHNYYPDYLIRLSSGVTLVLEVKGYETEETRTKHQETKRWINAVNNWGQLGMWEFCVCKNINEIPSTLKETNKRHLSLERKGA